MKEMQGTTNHTYRNKSSWISQGKATHSNILFIISMDIILATPRQRVYMHMSSRAFSKREI